MDAPKHWKLMDQCPAKNEISRCLQGEVGCADLPMEGTEGTWNISKALDENQEFPMQISTLNPCEHETSCCLAPGLIAAFEEFYNSTNNFSFCHANLIPQSTNPQIPIKIKSDPKKSVHLRLCEIDKHLWKTSVRVQLFQSYPPTAPTASSKAL